MTDPKTIPQRGTNFADQPHAYDPVAQPQLFAGVIGKRVACLHRRRHHHTVLTAIAYVVVALLGIITLGLAWLLFGLVFPVVGLGYNALTIGGPNSATIGQRMMGLEVRMWFGGKVTPLDRGVPCAPVLVLAGGVLPDPAVGLFRPAQALPARHSCRRRGDQPDLVPAASSASSLGRVEPSGVSRSAPGGLRSPPPFH